MSPSLLFLNNFRGDAWHLLPVRLGVLVKYGEGPHMTALALSRSRWRSPGWRWSAAGPPPSALAAVFCAAVASNNFYGATALAVFYPILVWSFWITRQESALSLPRSCIPVLAYGLTAFWLVPSYFRITVNNMKYVSEHGTTWSIWVALAVAVAYARASTSSRAASRSAPGPCSRPVA